LAEESRVQISRPGFITSKLGVASPGTGGEFRPVLQAQRDLFLSHFMFDLPLETDLFSG